jgi:ketosteroid isomerase-like protein
MGKEPEVERQRFDLRETTRRRWDERLLLRFPKLGYALVRTTTRRPPGSRLRRSLLRHAFERALEAANRGDYEAAFALIPPDYEAYPHPDLVGLGFQRVYRGPEERLRFQEEWIEVVGDFKQESGEMIDTGEQLLVLSQMKGAGIGSGAQFESELAYLLTISDGRLAREDSFPSHAEAFEAARLPHQVTSPDRAP